jgi:SsrA-binding protein
MATLSFLFGTSSARFTSGHDAWSRAGVRASWNVAPAQRLPRAKVGLRTLVARTKSTSSPSVENRRINFQYEVLWTLECGIELKGTEIKSVRAGKMNIRDAFARAKRGTNDLWLYNCHIAPHDRTATFFNHQPTRPRRLLAHKQEIRRLLQAQEEKGLTLVPQRCYFDQRQRLKVLLAVARGKKLHDKRESIRERDEARSMKRFAKYDLRDL